MPRRCFENKKTVSPVGETVFLFAADGRLLPFFYSPVGWGICARALLRSIDCRAR